MHYFTIENNYYYYDSQMQQFNVKQALRPSHPRKPGSSQISVPTADSIKLRCSLLNTKQIIFFVNKIKQNFKIGFNFVNHFFKIKHIYDK